MEKIGSVEIKITGSKNNVELSPDNYDIRELIAMLENADELIYQGDKKDRPIISCRIEDCCVNHIFKTPIRYVIAFNALIGYVSQNQNIDFLDYKAAKAFENIQRVAAKNNYAFNIKTSLDKTNDITVDNTTRFYKTDAIWADSEFYFYGKIIDAGGKDKANIHVETKEVGTIKIDTPISFLENYEENLLYKTFCIHAKGKQHSETGEIDKSTLEFIELVDYSPKYDEQYLNELIEKETDTWKDVEDVDLWLRELRGSYV
jgi:hypothetical protein